MNGITDLAGFLAIYWVGGSLVVYIAARASRRFRNWLTEP